MALAAHELVRIARTLAVAPERFAELAADEARAGEDDAGDGVRLGRDGPALRLRLKRRDDGRGRTRCVFLATAGSGREVCGLGALAPAACAAFPAREVTLAGGRAGAGVEVAGCWRTWSHDEVDAPPATSARAAAADVAAIVRWNAHAAERPYTMPATAFTHALLADATLGCAPSQEAAKESDALPEPRSQSGCATCTTSRCCVVFDPEVTGADLVRLGDGLGLAPHDVSELRPTRRDQAGADAILLGDGCAWDLRLRRSARPSGAGRPDDARRCGFLVDLAHGDLPAANRCGVYAHRPLVCRLFPSDLTAVGVMVDTPEAVCPPQAWSQERADLPALHVLHLAAQAERARFRAFVAVWNAAVEDAPRILAGLPHAGRTTRLLDALVAFERTFARAVRDVHEVAREVVAAALARRGR